MEYLEDESVEPECLEAYEMALAEPLEPMERFLPHVLELRDEVRVRIESGSAALEDEGCDEVLARCVELLERVADADEVEARHHAQAIARFVMFGRAGQTDLDLGAIESEGCSAAFNAIATMLDCDDLRLDA